MGSSGSRPTVDLASAAEVAAAWSGGDRGATWSAMIDERRFEMVRGAAGDHLFRWSGAADFHLDCDQRRLLCAPRGRRELGWLRVLLDSVLFSVSLECGYEALHAAAVTLRAGGVLALAGRALAVKARQRPVIGGHACGLCRCDKGEGEEKDHQGPKAGKSHEFLREWILPRGGLADEYHPDAQPRRC